MAFPCLSGTSPALSWRSSGAPTSIVNSRHFDLLQREPTPMISVSFLSPRFEDSKRLVSSVRWRSSWSCSKGLLGSSLGSPWPSERKSGTTDHHPIASLSWDQKSLSLSSLLSRGSNGTLSSLFQRFVLKTAGECVLTSLMVDLGNSSSYGFLTWIPFRHAKRNLFCL
jgi:hypothetical protein